MEFLQGTIFDGVLHLWIEVYHCDGSWERFDVWQTGVRASHVLTQAIPRYSSLGGGVTQRQPGQARGHLTAPRLIGLPIVLPCPKLWTWCQEPEPCRCLNSLEMSRYAARSFYFLTGPNSNTFVKRALEHCGISMAFPPGAIGADFVPADPDFDFFGRESYLQMVDRVDQERMTVPGGYRRPWEPPF